MKRKKIYISGRMSGLKESVSRDLFKKAEVKLREDYTEVINPWEMGLDDDFKWEDYLLRDLRIIFAEKPDMFMLSNWGESKGARIERAVAIELGLKIIYQ